MKPATCHPDKPHHARGLCAMCYGRYRAHTQRARSGWTCARCLRNAPRLGNSSTCRACAARLRAEQTALCSRCRSAVPLTEYIAAKSRCRACDCAERLERQRGRADVRMCGRCGGRQAYGPSAICLACHRGLRADGLHWCPRCLRAVPRAEFQSSECLACHRDRHRARMAQSAERRERRAAYLREWRARNPEYLARQNEIARKRRALQRGER